MNIVVYFVVFGIFGYFEVFELVSPQLNTYQDPMKCPAERCYCYADEDLECTDLLLTSVPNFYHTKYTRNITYALLDLSENKIKEIRPWAFADLSLRSIKIWRNHKKTDLKLYGDSFQGLNDCLEKLNLKKNNISKLPKGLFKELRHLRIIDMQENRMKSLSQEMFLGATSLSEINFDRNHISRLNENIFLGLDNLKKLDISRNHINFIDSDAFVGLSSLESLNLRRNKIGNLQPKIFEKLISLKILDLSHNAIQALFPLMMKGMHSAETLLLNNNPIVMISKNTFSSLKKLKDLHLEKCELNFFEADIFNGLTNLKRLYLQNNNINTLPNGIFRPLKSLVKLQLEYNRLPLLNACAFDKLIWKGAIYIIGNPIRCDCAMAWTVVPGTPSVYGKCRTPKVVSKQMIEHKDKYQVCRHYGVEKCHSGFLAGSLLKAKMKKVTDVSPKYFSEKENNNVINYDVQQNPNISVKNRQVINFRKKKQIKRANEKVSSKTIEVNVLKTKPLQNDTHKLNKPTTKMSNEENKKFTVANKLLRHYAVIKNDVKMLKGDDEEEDDNEDYLNWFLF